MNCVDFTHVLNRTILSSEFALKRSSPGVNEEASYRDLDVEEMWGAVAFSKTAFSEETTQEYRIAPPRKRRSGAY